MNKKFSEIAFVGMILSFSSIVQAQNKASTSDPFFGQDPRAVRKVFVDQIEQPKQNKQNMGDQTNQSDKTTTQTTSATTKTNQTTNSSSPSQPAQPAPTVQPATSNIPVSSPSTDGTTQDYIRGY